MLPSPPLAAQVTNANDTVAAARAFAWWCYWAVLGVSILILVARQPLLWMQPTLVLEDGSIFFAQAFSLYLTDAIIQPYSGYLHLIPRLVAELGSILPVAATPRFYYLATLLITAVAASWFYLPHFRYLVADDRLRFATVLLILCLPGADGLLLLSYVQWYVGLWGILVALMMPPAQRLARWTLLAGYALAVWTAPVLVILVPIWLIRLLKTPSRRARAWAAVPLLFTLTYLVIVIRTPGSFGGAHTDWMLAGQDVAMGAAFRVFGTTLFGYQLAREFLLCFGWFAVMLGSGCLAGLVAFMIAKSSSRTARYASVALAYIGVAATFLYFNRARYYDYMYLQSDGVPPLYNGRYFFVASCVMLLLLAICAGNLAEKHPGAIRGYAVVTGMILLLYVPSFRQAPWPAENWAVYSKLLTFWQTHKTISAGIQPAGVDNQLPLDTDPRYPVRDGAISNTPRPTYLADTYPANIPIAPSDWKMTLFVPFDQPGVYTFPEGVRLLGYDVTRAGKAAEVLLFWQGMPDVPGAAAGTSLYYTAYVHLLDENGNRIAGFDTELHPKAAGRTAEDVFLTQHMIDLPAAAAPGRHDLLVGVYHFEGDELVPGSTVLLPQAIDVP